MTNADGNAGETPPSDPGSQPSELSSSGYEAPSIEHSQDRPDTGAAQPSYEFAPPTPDPGTPYPPAIDYPADIPYDYPPPPGLPPSMPGGAGYPPPLPGYPPPPPGYAPPDFAPPGGYPAGVSGYPGYPGGYGMPPANPTNSMAIGSLVASVLSLIMFFACGVGLLAALVGIGLGIVALNQIKQSAPGFGPQSGQLGFGPQSGQLGYGPYAEQPGRGLAIAGIAVGAFGTLINGVWLLFFIGSALGS
ncbi:DUF4190 domain-containing protein [Mycolicibacterium peregrinum]|uniref:DUF4190 domain-containing protein n=1 Tax=Mycolicibacterium peregrinum TaxID=43304 RepID=A0A1A0VJN9_MYCPR|nr:DUF4190 domain-containing protein [Mycolicibacterium peregrinum]OBB83462.1 hypothetical protein A5779_07290 [Mycolicibacterium peregrinum]